LVPAALNMERDHARRLRFLVLAVRFVGLPAVPQNFQSYKPTLSASYCSLLPTRETYKSLPLKKKAGRVAVGSNQSPFGFSIICGEEPGLGMRLPLSLAMT